MSNDTVAALEWMLSEAKKGKIIGVAFAALYAGYEYNLDVVGAAKSNPTFTVGMLVALKDLVKCLIAS